MTTTVTTISAMTDLTFHLGIAATVLLIGCLVASQLAAAASGERAMQLRRALNFGIIPLLVAFLIVAAAKISTLL